MSKLTQKYHLLIPEKLLPVLEQIEINPPNISGFSISRMKFLISTILTHKQNDSQFSYSILNMAYLKKIVPRADEYLNLLKNIKAIECIDYSAGRNSRLYRCTKQYHGPTVWRTLNDQNLIRRIEETSSKLKFRNSKKYPQLNKYVHMVKIDVKAALRTIEESYQSRINNPDSEIRQKAEGRRIYSRGEVIKIFQGQIYIKVSKTNGRYDTNYTRLPLELVKHLTINGIHLLELDMVNSQPFFASGLFDPTSEIQGIMGKTLFMYTKRLHLSDEQDVKLYVSLVKEGNFYEFMMKKFKEKRIAFIDRQDFKEQLFTVFFGKNNAFHYSPAVRLFISIFPNVWSLFEEVKKKEHNKLAILLQRTESFTMLDCVAQKIIREFPEVPFLTKHDSILLPGNLTKEKSESIENLLIETIEKIIGHIPKLKRK